MVDNLIPVIFTTTLFATEKLPVAISFYDYFYILLFFIDFEIIYSVTVLFNLLKVY